jgi:hypothetical protein
MSEVRKITVNGREYDSIEHMPPEVRKMYSQAMAALGKAGAPGASDHLKANVSCVVKESIVCNNREYKSLDELPPEIRKLVEQMPKLSAGDTTGQVIEVKTETAPTEMRFFESPSPRDNRPERDPKVAWLLVSMLTVAVVVLLFLLYLSSILHKGR